MPAMPDGPLQVEVASGPQQGVTTIRLRGPLLINNLFDFQEMVRTDESPMLVIDLTAVPYMDSAGLGTLVNAYVSRQTRGRRIALISPTERVFALMQMTRVDGILPVYSKVEEVAAGMS